MSTTNRTWLRTVSRVLAIATALTLLGAGGVIAANLLLRPAPPAPLWTEKDLPPIPAASANGWAVLQDETARFRPEAPSSALSSLTKIDGSRTAGQAWEDVRGQRSAIVSYVAAPANAKWHSAMAVALSKPSFADGCPISIEANCQVIPLLTLHKLIELSILDEALEGKWAQALADSARLAGADFAFAASTRTLVTMMVSLRQSARIIDLIDVVLAGYKAAEENAERAPVGEATVRALDTALAGLREEQMDLQRAVIAEYLLGVDALTLVERSPGALTPGGPDVGPLARVLFDRGSTQRMLNEDYEPLGEYAKAPIGAPPAPKGQRATGMTWWLHNAVGKILMDTAQVNVGFMIEKAAREREALMVRHAAVRAQVSATFPVR